jgi:hypothetical protein
MVKIDDLGCYFIEDGYMFRSGCFSFKEGQQLSSEERKKFSGTKIKLKNSEFDISTSKKPTFVPKTIIPKQKKRTWL